MNHLSVVPRPQTFNNERVIDPLVGARVRKLREAKGWKQEDLARKAGIAANTVGGLERGKRETRWAKFEQVAAALGTTTDALQRGDGISDDHPLLRKLSDEDLRIANRFHDAETALRLIVERVLRLGFEEPMLHWWTRLETLDVDRRDTVLVGLALQEKRQAEDQRAKTGKGKPRKQ